MLKKTNAKYLDLIGKVKQKRVKRYIIEIRTNTENQESLDDTMIRCFVEGLRLFNLSRKSRKNCQATLEEL